VCLGEYALKPDLAAKYCSSYDDWAAMDEKHRQQRMRAAFKLSSSSNTSTSTNGLLTVPESPAAGKKKQQRKRAANVRTTSIPKRCRLHSVESTPGCNNNDYASCFFCCIKMLCKLVYVCHVRAQTTVSLLK
jgi:hypothetical protein